LISFFTKELKMLRRRTIKLRGEFGLDSTEAQWIHGLRDSGESRDSMVEIWQNHMKSTHEEAVLRVDYYLGNIGSEDVLKYLTPKEPSAIVFHEKVERGFWLKAHGHDAEFDVLLLAPGMHESEVKSLVANNQEDLCWLAYKNSHENPYSPHQLENGAIATPILMDDIRDLLG